MSHVIPGINTLESEYLDIDPSQDTSQNYENIAKQVVLALGI